MPDLIIRGPNVVLPDAIGPRAVHIEDGQIVAVIDYEQIASDCEVIDVDENSVVMPGLVDTHVHVNSPGRTEWEGFQTATRAAAAGGDEDAPRHVFADDHDAGQGRHERGRGGGAQARGQHADPRAEGGGRQGHTRAPDFQDRRVTAAGTGCAGDGSARWSGGMV